MNSTVEISLTRKLRELIGLQEIALTAEEADLYDIQGADLLEPDFLILEEGGYDHE
ncbi:hypothetical protein ABDD95_19285 [Mucilaginibacter sp. PAMB04274]|uniref:hypothetical protein n=1 Tax=Mucilaginibacter sp. PAMB04274 TaxID=3138568 RepID=UPI0031F607A0